MVRRLAWLIVAEVALANVLNAMLLGVRWLVARRVYARCECGAVLEALRAFDD